MRTALSASVVVLRADSRVCKAFFKVLFSAQSSSISLEMSRSWSWSVEGVCWAFGFECCLGRGIFDGFGVFSLSVLGVSTLMVSLNSLEFMVSQGRA